MHIPSWRILKSLLLENYSIWEVNSVRFAIVSYHISKFEIGGDMIALISKMRIKRFSGRIFYDRYKLGNAFFGPTLGDAVIFRGLTERLGR